MEEEGLQEFGGRLLRLMAINAISETEMLLQLSVEQETYNHWVENKVLPSETDVAMLVGYFGCNSKWLATGEGEPYGSMDESRRELHSDDANECRDLSQHLSKGAPANPAMQEMAQWISEQQDGINYWEVVKAKLAREYPEFREWLKKRQ